MKKISLLFPLLVLVAATLGCGYQFQGSGSVLPPDVKTVAIPTVQNNTTESGLALRFTEALRTRFERYGVVKVVEDARDADAVLNAKITAVNTRVRNTTGDTDVSVDLELIMAISAELKRKGGQVLWRDPSLRVSEPFAGVGDVVVTSSSQFAQGGISSGALSSLGAREVSRGQQEQALNDLIEEATRQIYMSAVAADF